MSLRIASKKSNLELAVVRSLQLRHLLSQLIMRYQHPSEPHKRPHDLDIDPLPRRLRSTLEKDRDALLGKGIRTISTTTMTQT